VKEPQAASIHAAFKCWHVESGEFTPDEERPSWGVFWEPLDVKLPPTAKPSCCYTNEIKFYDRSGNGLLADYVRHYGFIGVHPHLLFLAGKWREVVGGRVECRDGRWYMRWSVATNTRFAQLLNHES